MKKVANGIVYAKLGQTKVNFYQVMSPMRKNLSNMLDYTSLILCPNSSMTHFNEKCFHGLTLSPKVKVISDFKRL